MLFRRKTEDVFYCSVFRLSLASRPACLRTASGRYPSTRLSRHSISATSNRLRAPFSLALNGAGNENTAGWFPPGQPASSLRAGLAVICARPTSGWRTTVRCFPTIYLSLIGTARYGDCRQYRKREIVCRRDMPRASTSKTNFVSTHKLLRSF